MSELGLRPPSELHHAQLFISGLSRGRHLLHARLKLWYLGVAKESHSGPDRGGGGPGGGFDHILPARWRIASARSGRTWSPGDGGFPFEDARGLATTGGEGGSRERNCVPAI